MSAVHPVRIHSAKGQPPEPSRYRRCCQTCSASFMGLAAGKTGERGLWNEAGWYCSVECAPEDLRALHARAEAG